MAKSNHFGALVAAAGTLVAVGLVVLIMVVAEAGPAEATFPGKNGKIAFERDLVLPSQIFTINPDGSGLEMISTTLFGIDPAWSPDGKKIAFSRSAYSGLLGRSSLDIYVVNANGSSLKRITDSPTYDFNPSFSPDGKKIAFDRYGSEKRPNTVCSQSCIYTIRVDGTGLKLLTGPKAIAEDPDWSPNGKKIAYVRYDGHDSEISTINASGGTPFNVTNTDASELDPSYSPDGKKIAYVSLDGRHDSEISTINATGGKPVQVTYNHTHEYGPDWGSRP